MFFFRGHMSNVGRTLNMQPVVQCDSVVYSGANRLVPRVRPGSRGRLMTMSPCGTTPLRRPTRRSTAEIPARTYTRDYEARTWSHLNRRTLDHPLN